MDFKISSSFGKGNIQAISTIQDIANINEVDEITFDFTDYKENNPFNNLIIASSINNFSNENPNTKIYIQPKADNDYLCHLGFYDMLGIVHGKKIGQASPNSNYVPITIIDLSDMKDDFYGKIERKCRQLSALLEYDVNLSEFLAYAFVETIRNVYEHADTDTVYISAQKWPTYNLVEIAIVDNGCGIAKALKKRYKNKTELELMYLSALPGVSAKSNHIYLNDDDAWRNSGYGLYALRRLTKLYNGSFMICSGNYCLYQDSDEKEKYSTYYKGTAIVIRFMTNTNINFKSALSKIISDGEKQAKETAKSIKKASKSSGGNYNI